VAVAEAMRSVLRDDDLYARWGGDEFLVVLPSADLARGQALADRIQAAVRAVDLGHDLPADEVLRLSIGCVAGTGKINDLIRRADDALYEAKSLGGDLVVSVPPETDHLVGA